ncbi:O-antigen ligase family protein [Paenibacillus radicis (ex Xue et al. 2023)]|uniref:O-antigen ligase family protein n=1 Tax=Paenibacillus radicis (ex Xue et al. 2023) TaxID=2972489 RepID=A0ABT1YSI5_9BACL|nr:O-antigen ligase family protein [Paenibacillus radicis (ex Xue et al. 2023)]MCR8635967.1 O-antigen ligase family protein [Paenibacillus radicis (ex Xue et al. 2023)]
MSEKYVYGKKTVKQEQTDKEKTSLLFWLLMGFTSIFLLWAPFQKALFNGNTADFERPIYSSIVWGFIVLIVASIYLFYNWKLRDHRDILSIVIWLLPLSYLLAKVSEASSYFATNMLYIQMIYAIFFILGIYLCRGQIGNKVLTYSLMGSGYVIVWFGVLNWVGYKQFAAKMIQWFVELPGDGLQYQDAVMSAENQLRLTSTFQYANSYAAFLIALLLGAVYLILSSKKPQAILINAFMLVPIILSFFLTISRGGIVVLPIVILLVLPFMKLTKQIFFFIYLGIALIISLLILDKITIIGEQAFKQDLSSTSVGLWTFISASAICAVIIWVLHKYAFHAVQKVLDAKIKIKFANILLPAAALIIGSLGMFLLFGNTGATNLLPDYMKNRIENINFNQHSVLERGTFYKDAVKLIADYPVVGAGGGAWAALYEKYQNNPYVSRQAHNFFIQYLVETGIVGIVILIGFLIYLFSLYIRHQLKAEESSSDRHVFYILAVSLLVHSIIDFDLSYVFLGIVVFLSLGAMVSHVTIIPKLRFIKDEKVSYINKIYPSVLLVLSVIMFFISAQNLSANSLFRTATAAANSNKAVDEIFTPLDKALSIRNNHPDYTLFKTSILLQAFQQTKDERYYTELSGLLNRLKTSEPHNRYRIEQETQSYLIKDQLAKAQELTTAEIDNFPWDISLYERSIDLDMSLAEKARMQKDDASKTKYWNHAFTIHDKILNKMKELESLPKEQVQGRAFNVTKNMSLRLGQIEYIRGNYDAAISYLKGYVSDQFDDTTNKEIARWYLTALQKQNKNDQALFDKLVAKDPKEREEISKLASAAF